MQIAADAAAIAGALDWKYNGVIATATSAANAAATANGYSNGTGGVVVTTSIGPADGPNTSCGDCVEARVSVPNPTTFMGMFGFGSMNVTARAVAGIHSSEPCMLLDGAGTDLTNGGAETLNLHNCSFVDDSSSGTAFSNTGALTMTATNLGTIGIVGGTTNTGSESLSPTPIQTGITPSEISHSTGLRHRRQVAVQHSAITSAVTTTLSPGCYNGLSVTGAATLQFNPGTYVINGPIVTIGGAARLTGSQVTFVLDNGFTVGGAATLNLSAPTSAGTWNGILFYENPSDTTNFVITGASTSNLQGIIYLPTANLDLTGASSMTRT